MKPPPERYYFSCVYNKTLSAWKEGLLEIQFKVAGWSKTNLTTLTWYLFLVKDGQPASDHIGPYWTKGFSYYLSLII